MCIRDRFLAASHVLAGSPQTGKGVFTKLIASYPDYVGPDVTLFKPDVVDAYRQARADYAVQTIKTPAVATADSTAAPAAAPAQSSIGLSLIHISEPTRQAEISY